MEEIEKKEVSNEELMEKLDQLIEVNNEQREYIRRQKLMSQISMGINLVMIIAVVVVLWIYVPKVMNFVNEVQSMVDEFSAIGDTMSKQLPGIMDNLNSIDFEGLSSMIDEVSATLTPLKDFLSIFQR
ncbi:MAG: hypothetical protein Q4D13_01920 [Erysipelotrichaceae bacterium]|nr:hypothetical protein [Erysipelotrichaceae bacterium]